MADIVNLRRFRKQAARRRKAQDADENRARHGRTRSARIAHADEERRDARRLDALKLERDADASDFDPPDTADQRNETLDVPADGSPGARQ